MSFHPYAPHNAAYTRGLTRQVTGPTKAEAAAGIHVVVGAFFPLSADAYVHPTLAGFTAYAEPTIGEIGDEDCFVADGVGFIECGADGVGYVNPGYISKPGFNYLGYETVRAPEWRGEYSDAPYGKLGSSGVSVGYVDPGWISKPGFNEVQFGVPHRRPAWRGEYTDRPFGILGSSGLANPGWIQKPGFNASPFTTRRRTPAWHGQYGDRPFGILGSSGVDDIETRRSARARRVRSTGAFVDGMATPVAEVNGFDSGAVGAHSDAKVGLMYTGGDGRLSRILPSIRERRALREAEIDADFAEWDSQPTFGRKDTFIGRNLRDDTGVDYDYYTGLPADGMAVPVGSIVEGDPELLDAMEAAADVYEKAEQDFMDNRVSAQTVRDASKAYHAAKTVYEASKVISTPIEGVGAFHDPFRRTDEESEAIQAARAEERAQAKSARAARLLRLWAQEERFPEPLSAWKSSDGRAHGHLYELITTRDQNDIQERAKQIAGRHGLYYKMDKYSPGMFKVFFTDDPAIVDVDVEDALAAGIEVGRAFARKLSRRRSVKLGKSKGSSKGWSSTRAARQTARAQRSGQRFAQQSLQPQSMQSMQPEQGEEMTPGEGGQPIYVLPAPLPEEEMPEGPQIVYVQPPDAFSYGVGKITLHDPSRGQHRFVEQSEPKVSESTSSKLPTVWDGGGDYSYELTKAGIRVLKPDGTEAFAAHGSSAATAILKERAELFTSRSDGVSVGYVNPRPGVGPDDLGTYGRFFTYGRGSNFQYPL